MKIHVSEVHDKAKHFPCEVCGFMCARIQEVSGHCFSGLIRDFIPAHKVSKKMFILVAAVFPFVILSYSLPIALGDYYWYKANEYFRNKQIEKAEITLEKALINLFGILSGSKTYGQEKIAIQPKFSKSKKNTIIKFRKDLSWEKEIKEYINCIKLNKKIYNGTIHDAIEVMKMIDVIYKSDAVWRKFFFK